MSAARRHTFYRTALWWVAALGLALLLDRWLIELALPARDTFKRSKVLQEWKELGEFWITLWVAVSLAILHAFRWRAALLVIGSGLIGAMFELTFKWIVGRTRPVADNVINISPLSFNPFRGGWTGFVEQRNLCFPSGHALLAFSTAACLAYLCPRGKWVWFGGAVLVAINRIGEAAHYPSDTVGSAMLGVIACSLARRLLQMPAVGDGSIPLELQARPRSDSPPSTPSAPEAPHRQ